MVELDEKVVEVKTRIFNKELSIFKNWKTDTEKDIEQCLLEDFQYWKVPNLCRKDTYDLQKCQEVVHKYYDKLKHVYISLISGSEYPYIGQINFGKFCTRCGIVDKSCPMDVIDRAFIATNFEIEDMDDNPDGSLQRFEFIEILFRIADVKFKANGKVSTYHEAFERLLHEFVFKNWIPEPWQEFRENELWKLDPHDTMEVNQINLLKIYNWMLEKKGATGQYAFDKGISLATDSEMQIPVQRAKHCFGMSKMTVKNENKNAQLQFNVLKQPEFYEYIARLATEKYRDRPEITLAEKLNRLMDIMFARFGLARARVGVVEEAAEASSDDSVDCDEVGCNLGLFPEEQAVGAEDERVEPPTQ